MDFKLKFSENRNQDRPRQTQTNKLGNFRNTEVNRQNSQNQQKQNKSFQNNKNSAGGLNKYLKKVETGSAPPSQYKKYMLEACNIFYDERPEIKQISRLNAIKWMLVIIWLFLSISYILIGRIQQYKGPCPKLAKCHVFIHCPEYYQLTDGAECRLSRGLQNQFQSISLEKIQQLQFAYGQNQCDDISTVPTINLNELFSELEDKVKAQHYKSLALQFYNNRQNQVQHQFAVQNYRVIPTHKKYSFTCSLKLKFKDSHFLLDIFYVFIGIIVVMALYWKIMKVRRISQMYTFLKDRVLQAPEKLLNITHTIPDLQDTFGPLDEIIWQKINDLRAKERQIGYFEDDFLYWKAN